MKKYRTEQDFIGKMQVPIGVYYGVQTARALENFPITGYRLDRALIPAMGIVKKAAALANMEAGLLDERRGQAIVDAAQEVIEGKFNDQFVVDPIQGGAGTSINMNANEVIANRAIEVLGGKLGDYSLISPNSHVNMSQSTNDAFPTALRIALLSKTGNLLQATEEVETALRLKSVQFDDVLKMGRSHLQDAVPVRMGQEFGAYADAINRSIQRLRQARKGLLTVNMGATATGTALNADFTYVDQVIKKLREISGIDLRLAGNLVDATQNTDTFVELSSAMKNLATVLSKIANDLRLMASGPYGGLKEINLPKMQPGSSIMPGKVNPVIPEVVNQVAFQIMGNDLVVTLASEAGQFELNVMEPVMAFNLLHSINILTNVQHIFANRCIRGITANRDHCRKMVESSVCFVTALNPHLGYEMSCAIAKEAMQQGCNVRDIVLEKQLMTEEELDKVLDIYEMTKMGISGKEFLTKPAEII
ncbi:MAG: aspartate ammonia-lyase [Heliobacteriaceae bacterium]|nr:aspartate ammonia-lyase [Heliobacteriaceae bacterium]MDD4588757.1 aspartate ammonia-lyase [Heliobacteriaceae bacterium]